MCISSWIHCTFLTCTRCEAVVGRDVLYPKSQSQRRTVPEKRQAKYSTDGTCGPANGNLLCDPNATAYTGTCCSQYGWVC
jgi:hypothetical protein